MGVPTPAELVLQDSRYRAHQLRIRGMSWEQIAVECGYANARSVESAVITYLKGAAQQLGDDERMAALITEVEMLNQLQTTFYPLALRGSDKAAGVVLQISDRRSKLLRLYGSEEKRETVKTIIVPGEAAQYMAALQQIASGEVARATTEEIILEADEVS